MQSQRSLQYCHCTLAMLRVHGVSVLLRCVSVSLSLISVYHLPVPPPPDTHSAHSIHCPTSEVTQSDTEASPGLPASQSRPWLPTTHTLIISLSYPTLWDNNWVGRQTDVACQSYPISIQGYTLHTTHQLIIFHHPSSPPFDTEPSGNSLS